ncbi:hypothetical protein DXG01_013900 [Tephrocybe rancida]|nr:hypothetical protein DXG01_013900 [Tephrocybe rancida]
MSPPRPVPPPPPPTPEYVYTSLPQEQQHPYPSPPPAMIPPTPRFAPPDPRSSPPRTHTPTLSLHPLLRYSQHGGPALVWDLRTDPTPVILRQVTAPTSNDGTGTTSIIVPVPEEELLQPATAPPVSVLSLTCGIVPPSSTWSTIDVASSSPSQNGNPREVTVLDVLRALRWCMGTRLIQSEWDALPKKQQERVNSVFDSRWRESDTPAVTRAEGVLRQDCLLQHTLWAGLTPSVEDEGAAVLTLRRPDPNP